MDEGGGRADPLMPPFWRTGFEIGTSTERPLGVKVKDAAAVRLQPAALGARCRGAALATTAKTRQTQDVPLEHRLLAAGIHTHLMSSLNRFILHVLYLNESRLSLVAVASMIHDSLRSASERLIPPCDSLYAI